MTFPLTHTFPFDPTYGYSREQLLAIAPPPAPPDFDVFWRATFAETASASLRLETRESKVNPPGYTTREVYFDTLNRRRVGAWIMIPTDGKVVRGMVVGHGYGGREAPPWELLLPQTAAIFPSALGFFISAAEGLPSAPARHVIHGIDSRETYLIRDCVASMWSAASALIELCPDAARAISYDGGSFGGGLGALAIPWDARFARAHLAVPTFGHHPIRLQCPCNGSGDAVRVYHQHHPEVIEVLRYFDAATAATRTTIPVLASPALFDPSVPPPGQFAVCNALAGPKKLLIARAGHFPYPEQAAEEKARFEALREWFA
ncbi:MAG: acetylxylan esterase [Planctomycetota bacterium]|nr:acetylxylan esterase [Planctomycetota bacterium]